MPQPPKQSLNQVLYREPGGYTDITNRIGRKVDRIYAIDKALEILGECGGGGFLP